MQFKLLGRNEKLPYHAKNLVCLTIDSWNDYSYVTMFFMNVFDNEGNTYRIGNIKIGFEGQTEEIATYKKIQEIFNSNVFNSLPDSFFSLGQDVEFYVEIQKLPEDIRTIILNNLNDIVYKPVFFDRFQNEPVFNTSLIEEQFRRILDGKSKLDNFNFYFIRSEKDSIGGINLEFNVIPNSMPSSNIHAIIGRNGVGKTTLLNGMIKSFIDKTDNNEGGFYEANPLGIFSGDRFKPIGDDYFSHLVAVSFSVFDPFIPNREELKYYHYIGLKESNEKLKEPINYFEQDFWNAFSICKSLFAKKERWLNAIKNLETDNILQK